MLTLQQISILMAHKKEITKERYSGAMNPLLLGEFKNHCEKNYKKYSLVIEDLVKKYMDRVKKTSK